MWCKRCKRDLSYTKEDMEWVAGPLTSMLRDIAQKNLPYTRIDILETTDRIGFSVEGVYLCEECGRELKKWLEIDTSERRRLAEERIALSIRKD